MSTVSIVFLILTILFILIPVIISLCTKEGEWMMISILSLLTFFIFAVSYWPMASDEDVRDGKAIYVTEQNVGLNQNGDTIYNYNTYHLEWLPEWKYGRKH